MFFVVTRERTDREMADEGNPCSSVFGVFVSHQLAMDQIGEYFKKCDEIDNVTDPEDSQSLVWEQALEEMGDDFDAAEVNGELWTITGHTLNNGYTFPPRASYWSTLNDDLKAKLVQGYVESHFEMDVNDVRKIAVDYYETDDEACKIDLGLED